MDQFDNQNPNQDKVEYDYIEGGSAGIDKKKIVFLVIVVILAIGLAIGSIFLIRSLMNKGYSEELQATTTKAIFDKSLSDTYKVDKDFDGIIDSDEKKYGTSATSSDTDEDGLTDYAEINTYKTNPTKADTDGDGFSDGYEVRRNLNPNGSGKL